MLSALMRMLAPREHGAALDAHRAALLALGFLSTVSIVALLWLAWDHRVDAVYAGCAILAFAASSRIWLGILHLPFSVPHTIVVRWLSRFAGRGIDRTSRYLRARERGSYVVWLGNQRLARLGDQHSSEPTWLYRLLALAKLGYLPLLLAFWLT